MYIIKVVYDNSCKFILDIVNKHKDIAKIKTYNLDVYYEKRKAIPILVENGTRNVPLIAVTRDDGPFDRVI